MKPWSVPDFTSGGDLRAAGYGAITGGIMAGAGNLGAGFFGKGSFGAASMRAMAGGFNARIRGGDFLEGLKSTGLWDLAGYGYGKMKSYIDHHTRETLAGCEANSKCYDRLIKDVQGTPRIGFMRIGGVIMQRNDGRSITYLADGSMGSSGNIFSSIGGVFDGMTSQYGPDGHSYSNELLGSTFLARVMTVTTTVTANVHDSFNAIIGYMPEGGIRDYGYVGNSFYEAWSFAGMVPAAAVAGIGFASYAGGSISFASTGVTF